MCVFIFLLILPVQPPPIFVVAFFPQPLHRGGPSCSGFWRPCTKSLKPILSKTGRILIVSWMVNTYLNHCQLYNMFFTILYFRDVLVESLTMTMQHNICGIFYSAWIVDGADSWIAQSIHHLNDAKNCATYRFPTQWINKNLFSSSLV